MEPEGSLPQPQVPATCPNPESDQSRGLLVASRRHFSDKGRVSVASRAV